MKLNTSPHGQPKKGPGGIKVVDHLPLKKRFYLVEVEGEWHVFLSSLFPESHASILQVLADVGPMVPAREMTVAASHQFAGTTCV